MDKLPLLLGYLNNKQGGGLVCTFLVRADGTVEEAAIAKLRGLLSSALNFRMGSYSCCDQVGTVGHSSGIRLYHHACSCCCQAVAFGECLLSCCCGASSLSAHT